MTTLRALFWLLFGDLCLTFHDGRFCSECRDVHKEGACIRAMAGICVDCEDEVRLDRFGNCLMGHRSILRRRLLRPKAA